MENKPLLPRPATLNVDESLQDLSIERKWFSPKYIFFLVFSVIWNGFVIVIYGIIHSSDPPFWVYFFPLLHASAGIFIFYISMAGFFNKTLVKADKMQVSVKHFPLPWAGNKTIDRHEVKQLYVRKNISRNKNSTTTTFDVMLIDKSDASYKLLAGLEDSEEARFVEKKLESFWNITDVKVEGEF